MYCVDDALVYTIHFSYISLWLLLVIVAYSHYINIHSRSIVFLFCHISWNLHGEPMAIEENPQCSFTPFGGKIPSFSISDARSG